MQGPQFSLQNTVTKKPDMVTHGYNHAYHSSGEARTHHVHTLLTHHTYPAHTTHTTYIDIPHTHQTYRLMLHTHMSQTYRYMSYIRSTQYTYHTHAYITHTFIHTIACCHIYIDISYIYHTNISHTHSTYIHICPLYHTGILYTHIPYMYTSYAHLTHTMHFTYYTHYTCHILPYVYSRHNIPIPHTITY